MLNKNIRLLRLKNDYGEMLKVKDTPVMSWRVTKGTPPKAEEYLVTFRVKTYVAPDKTADDCQISIRFPEDYPLSSPIFKAENSSIFNPSFSDDGVFTNFDYKIGYNLVSYLQRIFYSLQFKEDFIPEESPSNREVMDWYNKNKRSLGIFPCDNKDFPLEKIEFSCSEDLCFTKQQDSEESNTDNLPN